MGTTICDFGGVTGLVIRMRWGGENYRYEIPSPIGPWSPKILHSVPATENRAPVEGWKEGGQGRKGDEVLEASAPPSVSYVHMNNTLLKSVAL